MLSALQNAFKVGELRQKLLFTLAMLLVFRFGAHIPVVGVDTAAMERLFQHGGLLGFLDLFAGGALSRFSIFAMGIAPYINASIISQLLTVVIPRLGELAKQGEEGRRIMTQYIRYGTVILGAIQAIGMSFWLKNVGVIPHFDFFTGLVVVITLTAGTAFLMWLGEMITGHGIGNGISIIIFAGILAGLPGGVVQTISLIRVGGINLIALAAFLVIAIVVTGAVIFMQEGQRRKPVQYAKRVVVRKVYGGQSTHIPLRINQAGVIPVIFASSILLFPATLAQFFPDSGVANVIRDLFSPNSILYNVLYALLIVFFTYFYTAITFNPVEMADNLKKYSGFVPGIRPGKPTAEYIDRVATRITLAGAVFLAFVAVLPTILIGLTGVQTFYFGGTALLIVVGVVLETMKQLEAHLLMKQYEGFMK